MKKLIPNWEFWFAVIGGICLSIIYIFDVKSMVMVQSEQIIQIRSDIAAIKQHLKDHDVVSVFNPEVPKQPFYPGAD